MKDGGSGHPAMHGSLPWGDGDSFAGRHGSLPEPGGITMDRSL